MMKSFSFILTLLSLSTATTAFVAAPSSSRLSTTSGRPLKSYLSSLGGEDLGNTPQQNNDDEPSSPKNPKDFFARRADEDRTRRLEERLNQLEQQEQRSGSGNTQQLPGTNAGGRSSRDSTINVSSSKVSSNDNPAKLIAGKSPKLLVQGGSLKTWSFASPAIARIHVCLKTDGRPLDADISLWQGPDNTPHKMRVYVEDGAVRPFSAVMETPRCPNTIQIRNTGQLEFPLSAHVLAETIEASDVPSARSNPLQGPPQTIQGGALKTYPFDPSVDSVQILLTTDGRPLNARIELLQGPNNNKQVMEVYTEDGMDRPCYLVIETPGSGNVVRVVNSATVEFPLTAWVEPFLVGAAGYSPTEPVLGGDDGFVKQW